MLTVKPCEHCEAMVALGGAPCRCDHCDTARARGSCATPRATVTLPTVEEAVRESQAETPFAVLCDSGSCNGGRRLFLTEKEYERQMDAPNAFWKCPRCGDSAEWDDEWYEAHVGA